MKIEEAIKNYQCVGCVSGPYPECFSNDGNGSQCDKHCAGTTIFGIGSFFLGMPTGFNRKGSFKDTKISIYESLLSSTWGAYDKLNVPVWKYLDEHGNTIVRGICPRTNYPWIHIFLENCILEIDCIEITDDDLNGMD